MDDQWTFNQLPEILDEDACLPLLKSRDLGRIAFDASEQLEIFPVNYGMEGRTVVFRTGPGMKLDVVARTPVAFEVDSWEPRLGTGWSVVVKGRAEEITLNPGRAADHLRQARVQPAAPGGRWHWIALKPSLVTGRRFQVRPHLEQERPWQQPLGLFAVRRRPWPPAGAPAAPEPDCDG